MASDFLRLLTTLGLGPVESRVYLASHELGPTSMQLIARKAGLSRSATYEAAKSLEARGLMSSVERKNKRFFAAEPPERLQSYFEQKSKRLTDHLEVFSTLLPELCLRSGGERPCVRFYEGHEALFALYADVARVDPPMLYEVSNIDDVYKHLDTHTLHEARKVLEGKSIRMLVHGALRRPLPRVEARVLEKPFGDIHGNIWIYADRVALMTITGRFSAIIVENAPLAHLMQTMFDGAWNHAQPLTTETNV